MPGDGTPGTTARIPVHVIHQADRHTQAVQAWLASRAPDATRLRGTGVQVSSTGLNVPLLNLALGGDYPPGTPEDVITGEITRVKAFFAQRGWPWYWWETLSHGYNWVAGRQSRYPLESSPNGWIGDSCVDREPYGGNRAEGSSVWTCRGKKSRH